MWILVVSTATCITVYKVLVSGKRQRQNKGTSNTFLCGFRLTLEKVKGVHFPGICKDGFSTILVYKPALFDLSHMLRQSIALSWAMVLGSFQGGGGASCYFCI